MSQDSIQQQPEHKTYIANLYKQLAETRQKIIESDNLDPGSKFTSTDKWEYRTETSNEALVTFWDWMGIVGFTLNRALGTSIVFWVAFIASGIAASIAAYL